MTHLPKEVLDLFPMWEYQCPICHTYYAEAPISFCSNCKTPFNEENSRVPPRFLKSKGAMSKYAHEILAPKLTPEQRELLFKYFTAIFSDGFESGDFTAWTGRSDTTNVIIVTTPVHHGTYGMQATSGTWVTRYAYKQYATGYTTIFARIYVRFGSVPTLAWKAVSPLKLKDKDGSDFARIGIVNSDTVGTSRFLCKYYSGGAEAEIDGPWFTVSATVWYCIELKVVRAVGTGEVRFWKGGVLENSATGLDNSAQGTDIDELQVGITHSEDSGAWGNIYVDCAVIGDVYIGPEFMAWFKENLAVVSDVFSWHPRLFIRKVIQTVVVRVVSKRFVGFPRKFIQNLSVMKHVFSFIYTPFLLPVYKFVENLSVISDVSRRVVSKVRKWIEDLVVPTP